MQLKALPGVPEQWRTFHPNPRLSVLIKEYRISLVKQHSGNGSKSLCLSMIEKPEVPSPSHPSFLIGPTWCYRRSKAGETIAHSGNREGRGGFAVMLSTLQDRNWTLPNCRRFSPNQGLCQQQIAKALPPFISSVNFQQATQKEPLFLSAHRFLSQKPFQEIIQFYLTCKGFHSQSFVRLSWEFLSSFRVLFFSYQSEAHGLQWEACSSGVKSTTLQCCDQVRQVLGLALCKHSQQKIYLFQVKRTLSIVGVINYLSVVENNGDRTEFIGS